MSVTNSITPRTIRTPITKRAQSPISTPPNDKPNVDSRISCLAADSLKNPPQIPRSDSQISTLGARFQGLLDSNIWRSNRPLPPDRLPKYPESLKNFLGGACSIWPGKKREETHFVVPIFAGVVINNRQAPLTCKNLFELSKSRESPHGFKWCMDWFLQKHGDIRCSNQFHWLVMTQDVIPASVGPMSFEEKSKKLPPGYTVPRAFHAIMAYGWRQKYSKSYTQCEEEVNDTTHNFKGHVIVGNYNDECGMAILPSEMPGYPHFKETGIAGIQIFKCE